MGIHIPQRERREESKRERVCECVFVGVHVSHDNNDGSGDTEEGSNIAL